MIRWLALIVAAGVLVRLVLNPYVLEYPLAATPIFNWLLYGYGVPALAFIVATRQFGSRGDDLTLPPCSKAGSIVFTTALLTLELRHFLTAHIDTPFTSLGRDSTNSLLWLAIAGVLLWLGARKQRPVLHWGGVVMFAAATVQIVLWQVLIANPLATGDPVGPTLVFDALSIAYALPALIYAAIAMRGLGPPALHWTARILAAFLAFLWLTLEIRHAFRGENLVWGSSGEGEWYAYSAGWLLFAVAGLGLGLYWRSELAAPGGARRDRARLRQGLPQRHGRADRHPPRPILYRARRRADRDRLRLSPPPASRYIKLPLHKCYKKL